MDKPILFSELMHPYLVEFVDAVHYSGLKCYASEFVQEFELDETCLLVAVKRAMQACQSLNIPAYSHLRKVYRVSGDVIHVDWKLSPYGCYLTLINADPSNKLIARFQSSMIIGD